MFCPKCGEKNDDNAFRCIKCAEVIQAVVAKPSPSTFDDSWLIRTVIPIHRSGLAVLAGYAGLLSVFIIFAPVALILGILAVTDIKRHPEKHGMGRAIFGIVAGSLGSFFIILQIIGLILYIID